MNEFVYCEKYKNNKKLKQILIKFVARDLYMFLSFFTKQSKININVIKWISLF